jgi:arylsulfatase A-like enzyme
MRICIAFLLTGMLLFSACQSSQTTSEKQPNIIFMMTDDHAFQAIGAYGSKINQTPHIDQLAEAGIRFDRCYVTNSICAPSRAVILTGKHSHINGVLGNAQVFDGSQQTFPKLLQQAGYETAMVGKWHLKSEPTGFNYWRVLPGQGHYYNPDFKTPEGSIQVEGYVTDIITDFSLQWLDSLRDKSKPFMLMYQHKAPHREWLPPKKHLKTYKDGFIPEPETLFDNYEGRGRAAHEAEMRISDHMGLTNDSKIPPEVAEELGFKDFLSWYSSAYKGSQGRMTPEQKAAWDEVYGPIVEDFKNNTPQGQDLVKWKYQRYMQDYLASIQSVDDNIGRLMAYLKEEGLDQNTIVMYTSDQGFYLGEHGWFDKRFMYEESFRTPLIISWPGTVQPGSVNTSLVQNLDFAETILDIAGVPIPDDMQGKSMVPVLTGQNVQWRNALYYHYYEYPGIHAVKRHYGVCTERYKLIHFYYDIDEWELYDLKEDPQELNNVVDDPAYAGIKTDLLNRLQELQTEYHDSDKLRTSFLPKR